MDEKPLVFLHVMKCGGTSVRRGLAIGATGERYGPGIFELDGESAKAAAGGTDADNWRLRDALLTYVLLAMRPTIVLGHFRYRDRHQEFLDTAHFVTVLRDPLERLVSLYKWRRYQTTIGQPVSITFDEWISKPRWAKAGHEYVDIFCGNGELDPRSDEAVAAAVANLGRFAVVGFTDHLDAFSREVSACLGKEVVVPMLNTSPAPEDADFDAAALEQARAACAPDTRVYEQVLANRASSRQPPVSSNS